MQVAEGGSMRQSLIQIHQTIAPRFFGGLCLLTCLSVAAACSAPSETEALGEIQSELGAQGAPLQLPIETGVWYGIGQGNNIGTHTDLNQFAIDMAATSGSSQGRPVYAPVGGTVSEVDVAHGYLKINVFGNCSLPLPGTQASSTCVRWVPIHIASSLVSVGQTVTTGQQVATIGDVGTEPGNFHLHSALSNEWGTSSYQTVVSSYVDYDRSTDSGATWSCMPNSTPQTGDWIRRQPAWTNWTSLGGGIKDSPSAVTVSSSAIELYGRGLDDNLWTNSWNGSQWSGWSTAVGAGMTSAPAVIKVGTTRHAYARGTDGALWENVRTSSGWLGWGSLGGGMVGDPAAVALTSSTMSVFVRGTNDKIWSRTFNGTSWSAWSQISSTLTVQSAPAAYSDTNGVIRVFARGTDNALWEVDWNGTQWLTPGSHGGAIMDKPTVSSSVGLNFGPNVYGRGADNRLWQRARGSNFWVNWCDSGLDGSFTFTNAPSAARLSDSKIAMFVRNADGSVSWKRRGF